MSKRLAIALVLAVCLTLALGAFAPGALAKKAPTVVPPTSVAYGHTYGEWGAMWWQWALAIPKDKNPLQDATGALAGEGQSGPVFFLCGTVTQTQLSDFEYIGVARRKITVPAHTPLFFPIVNTECSTAEGNGTTVAELTAMCDFFTSHTTALSLSIDNQPVPAMYGYRGTSGGYQLWWPDDAVLALPPLGGESTLSVSDGYWALVKPLSPGTHTLHWTGTQEFSAAAGDGFDGIFSQDITYRVKVLDD